MYKFGKIFLCFLQGVFKRLSQTVRFHIKSLWCADRFAVYILISHDFVILHSVQE